MARQTLLKSTLCLLMALVCGVAWAQTNTPVKQTSAPADGYYLIYSESSSGKGWIYYNENGQEGKKYRVDIDVDLKTGVTDEHYAYVWKLFNDAGQGTFTLLNNEKHVYMPADDQRNKNMVDSTEPANLKISTTGVEGEWFIAQTNYKNGNNTLYIHTNTPNGDPCLSYYDGHSATGTSIRVQFYKLPETTYTVKFKSGANVVATTTVTYPAGFDVPESLIESTIPEGYSMLSSTHDETTYTVNVSALPAISDAPADGQWAANTTWFQIKNQKNKFIRIDALTSEGYLALTNGNATSGDVGLWCIVGNETDGYKFYNRAKGTEVVLGMTGSEAAAAAVFVAEGTEEYTTRFDIVASTEEGHWCMKEHGSANNYWNQRDPRLAYWAHDNAQKGDDGSTFLFSPIDVTTITGYASESEITAAQALIKVAPGYPKTTSVPYLVLNTMVNGAGKGIISADLTTAINNYKTCTDIILPENGKAYTIANYTKTGITRYLNYTVGSAMSVKEGEGNASVFVCRELSTGVYAFVTEDGKVLTWMGSGDGFIEGGNRNGYSTFYGMGQNDLYDWNNITVKSNKNTNDGTDFGLLRLVARRSSSYASASWVINVGDGSWNRNSSDAYNFNENYSSAWIITEATHENTEAQNLALAKIDATIELNAKAGNLSENVGYTHYVVNGNEIYTAAEVKTAIDACETIEAVNAIMNSYAVTLPKAGTAYKMAFKTKAGASHYFTVDGTTLSTSTEAEAASVFYCTASTSNNFPYVFISEDGKYLKYHGKGASSANTLTDSYIEAVNSFKVEGMIEKSSQYINSTVEIRLGTVAITVDKRTENDNTDGCFVLKNSVTPHTFDAANAPIHNDNATSAIIMTKVEEYTAPDAVNAAVQIVNTAILNNAKTAAKALITANQFKLGNGIGYASYTVNGNKVITADAVMAAIDAATSADEINAIKESFQYEIPLAGVPYALYDATHDVYLDIHNLGKEMNDQSQDKLATLNASVQPLYITGDTNNGTWKIHTTPKGGNYLHQASGTRDWNSWVSNEPGDFSWGVEVSTAEGEITYKLQKLTGGYLGTDVALHTTGEPLYVNVEAAKALNLKLITLPVLTVSNLDAEGVTYPYALSDEQADKVFGQNNLTIAIDVTTATMGEYRQALVCAADPRQAITGATKNNSPYIAYGFYKNGPSYLASSRTGDRFTYDQAFPVSNTTNYKIAYVIDRTNNKLSIYANGEFKGEASYPNGGYELQSFSNFSTTDGDKLYIGGGAVSTNASYDKFGGTIHSVKFYNYALTAEEIAAIEYPSTDKQQVTALNALITATQELINSCNNYYHTEVTLQTTDVNGDYYVSTNAQSAQEGPIANLVDGQNGTFFHSDYSGANSTDGLDHHITIALGNNEINTSFRFKYVTRQGADSHFPSIIKVYGGVQSAEDIDYEELTTINSGLPTSGGKEYISAAIAVTKQYSHLRFMVTKNSNNTAKGGHQFFHMAEFDLMPRQAEPVIIYPNSVVLPTALTAANAAVITAQEEADKVQTAVEYEAATIALQAVYDELVAAIANGNRPILISLDPSKPYIYKIGSKRGNTKVLQLDYNGNPKQMVAIEDYDATNMEQAWYFTKGSDDEKVFIHPFMAGGNVLSASSTDNARNAVWAAEKGTVTHQEWTVQVVDKANGTYNIKTGDGRNYFSHNGGFGVTKYMGFWNDKPTTDTGTLLTFEHIELKDILEAYKNTHCTKESYPVGNTLGYYQGGAVYNEARSTAVEVLGNEDATAENYKNAYIALRDAKGALKFLAPEAGKFYRIKAVDSWNDDAPYLGANNHATKTKRAEFVANIDESTIFYFDGTQLLSYKSGLYLMNNDDSGTFLGYNGIQTTGSIIAFHEASNSLAGAGAFNISFNNGGRWLYCHTDNYTDAGGRGTANGYCFNIEEVTALPVAISAAGYTTLYAPVTLEIPAEVKAYVAEEVTNSSVLLGQVEGVVPAETGLIIKGNQGEYSFNIGGNATAEITKNELKGTVAKSLITPEDGTTCYVLANPQGGNGVGLYKASLNKDANGATNKENGIAFINNGFKVYLPVANPPAGQAARALMFRFGGTTEIELPTANGQQPTAVYDLQGRRVLNPTKGMYIINGKKVVIR